MKSFVRVSLLSYWIKVLLVLEQFLPYFNRCFYHKMGQLQTFWTCSKWLPYSLFSCFSKVLINSLVSLIILFSARSFSVSFYRFCFSFLATSNFPFDVALVSIIALCFPSLVDHVFFRNRLFSYSTFVICASSFKIFLTHLNSWN